MENYYANQIEIRDALSKFLTNFKKDGADRKTIDYCKKKMTMLEDYWTEFQRNHRKLCEYAILDHEYFTSNCFETTENLYITCSDLITKTIDQLGGKQKISRLDQEVSQDGGRSPKVPERSQPGTSTRPVQQQLYTSSGSYSKRDELIRKQTINFRAFMRTVNTIEVNQLENKWEFEDTLKSLQSRWSAVDSLHWEIEGEGEGENTWYLEEFNKHEKIYMDLKKTINTKMWSVSHQEKSMPQMDIPVFSGSYHHWVSFKDLFNEAIHKNPSLSKVQKMQFLKSKIAGDAERLIHHLQISSDNYDVCWDILNLRYSNKKLIFTSHINTLLGFPNIQHQSAAILKKLHDVTKESLHAIQNLGVDIDTWDPLLVHLLGQKLDNETFCEYIESVKNPRELPVLQELLSFLECKFTALEASRRKQEPQPKSNSSYNSPRYNLPSNQKNNLNSNHNYHYSRNRHNVNNNAKPNMSTFHVSRTMTCVLCNADHGIWQCIKFLQMSNEQKLNTVNQFNLCRNCLTNHYNKACFSNKRCRKCLGTHNTLMHEALVKNKSISMSLKPTKYAQNVPNIEHVPTSSHVSSNNMPEILLATAIVKVTGGDGIQHTMRALIDQGSQISLINEHIAQTLGLKRNQCRGKIFGVGEKENHCKGTMNIEVRSMYNDFSIKTSVFIMNTLIKSLPNKTFTKPLWSHIENINLADPKFNESKPVDLLLGADVYSKIMLGGILRGDDEDQPIAQQTQFGWLLCGSMTPYYRCNVVFHNIDDIRKFWENEEISQPTEMSSEDHECLQYFLSTTKRLEDGRYEVRLPFKPERKNELGATKTLALAQFRSLERKLEKDSELKTAYQTFMNEYRNLNHMTLCTTHTIPECYLPHHAVQKEGSTPNKFRVVFNASAKSSTGTTLNDVMYSGPNLQQDLQELILKWRQYQYVYTADIEKMYRQILVHKEDRVYQKILWRESPSDKIQSFQLTTVTYGTKSAPFLAMMCLKQLAKDERQNFSEASRMLENSFYMDDFCGGSDSVKEALRMKTDLIKLLKSGGFNLRKWTSNEPQLLSEAEIKACNQQTYEFKQPDTAKTLGLGWSPKSDNFIFSKLPFEIKPRPTKRSLLSDISKLFDPLGWVTPVSTTMKLLFREVFLSKIDWDELLPENIKIKWDSLREDLNDIHIIKVKRWLGLNKTNQTIQVHGFCDASDKAYACVIYCRVTTNGQNTITLIAAKGKLAPISKTVSTPRLELMGAVLLSQLMKKVLQTLADYRIEVFCWSDSTAVLGWLQGEPARWKPFVANRVKLITAVIPSNYWRYVKSKENPADCASRGFTIKQLKQNDLWWQGPSWLSTFNIEETSKTCYKTDLELKTSSLNKQTNVAIINQSDETISNIITYLLNKFSSINKIIRIFAWILRIPIYRKEQCQPYLTLFELRRAKTLLIKFVQQWVFTEDLEHLKRHNKVHSKSKILNLNPIIDKQGLLRVGGRLRNAQIGYDMKHPIILPHNHSLTILLIREAHEITFHGGAKLTSSYLRQYYWIIGGYMATKKYIRQCVPCKKQEPMKQYQLMGDLPDARVNPEPAFYHCGVDYTGFIEVKANKGRGVKTCKGYIVIFICMVTKAVHIELVSDLTSSAFLAALQRMAARRGAPRHLYSDNGTNFIGANRLIQEEFNHLLQLFSNSSFLKEVTELGIEWHFNAPSWPNAGGLWERAVRSLKHHLRRVVGHQKLTYEEYNTLLSKVEACLNSRPLCALSEDPEDLDFLTPAHFLSARPGLTIIETEEDARTRWYLTSKLFQDLWKRWKAEYLTMLSARNKWKEVKHNIQVGDLVVIHEDNVPPGKWAMGRVTETHPGYDGLVRVVTLKTKNCIVKRPVVKLSVLPISNSYQTDINHTKPSEKDEKPEEKEERGKRRKSRRSKFVSIITAITFLMTLLLPSYANQYTINELPINQTLYFDHITNVQLIRDKWTLIFYYDMEPFWDGLKSYDKISAYLDKLCTIIENQSHCHMITLQLHNEFEELKYYNELLLSQHFNVHARRRRRRRGLIDGVGYLANDLFGILDSRFAEHYTRDIETIRRNEKRLSDLWKNQTSVIEAEFSFMKNIKETVDRQHKFINKKLNEIEVNNNAVRREIQNISYIQDFTMSAMAGSGLLQSLRRHQDALLDAITDIYHGQVSVHLLTPEQLKTELRTIYGQMPKEVTLPITNIDSDVQYIYRLIRIKARVTYKYTIFEIIFPLISREIFQLYKILPVPHQVESSMVTLVPVSDYVAVNMKQNAYFTTTINELSSCSFHKDIYLCQLFKPIMNIEGDEGFCDKDEQNPTTCKVKKSICVNSWTELNTPSQYLYFCCDNYPVKIICDAQVIIKHLSRAGIIGMDQECIVKGKDFTLYSLQQQSHQLNYAPNIFAPVIDPINHIVNLKIPDTRKLPDDPQLNTSLTILGDQIKELKSSKSDIDDISTHDIHHYTSTYILLTVIVVATGVWCWKYRQCGRRPAAAPLRRREEGHAQQDVTHVQPQPTVPAPVYSEVYRQLSVSDLRPEEKDNSVQVRVQNFDKHWRSVNCSVSANKRDVQTSPIPNPKRVIIEDSIV